MSIYLLDTIDSLSVSNLSASNLANVAYSGSFNDLSDVPQEVSLSLPTSASWDSTYSTVLANSATWSSAGTSNFNGQYSALQGSPVLNQVALDGSYNSLSGLPILFNGQYSALEGLPDTLSLPTSASWDSTYSTVLANSATWSSAGTSNFNGQYSALEGVPSDVTFSSSVSAPVVFTSTIKGDGSWNGYSDPTYLGSVEIVPNESLYGQGQYLKIRPTSNFDEQHIHIESGLNGDLVLGNDDFYYKLNGHARLSDNNYHNLAEIGVSEKNSISTIVNDLFFNGGTLSLNLSSYGWANNLSVGNIINVNGQSLSITTVGNVYYNNDEPFVQVVFYPSVSAAVIPGDSVEFNYKPRKIYSFDSSGNLNLPEGGSIKNNLGNDIINTDWNSTYSTVLANSAIWSSVGTINNFNGQYSALANLPSFNQVAFDGAYSSLSGKPQAVTDLINGQVTGDLLITGALTAAGGVTFNSSVIVTTTSALSVINAGPGPALYIQQGVGSGDIASFYDADGLEALHIGNAKNTVGQDPSGVIGVNTSFPNKTLSVAGEISASQQIWAPVATFSTSVSAPALSGVHYGSGSSLTGLLTSNITGFSGSVSAILPVRSVANKYGNVSLCSADINFVNANGGVDIGSSWNTAPSQAIVLTSVGGSSTEQNAINIGYANTVRCFSVGIGYNNRVGRDSVLIGRNAGRNTADGTKTYGSVSIGAYAATTSQECLNVAIGHSANQTASDTGCSVAIGYGSTSSSWGVSLGTFSTTTSPSAVSLGAYASAVNLGVAIGYGAKANCCGIAIGANSIANGNLSIGSSAQSVSSTTATDFSGRYLPLNLNGTVGVVPVYANTAEFSAAVVRYAPSSTISIPTSANWDNTYTIVQSNSATWGLGGGGGSNLQTQLNISSDYTLALTDNNNTVRTTTTSASPSLILSLPSYNDVAFPVGSVVTIIQGDTGSITLSAASGVTFVTKQIEKNQTFNKGSVVLAYKTQTNEWLLTGDLGIQGAYFYASTSGFPDNRWYNINSWYGDINRQFPADLLPNSEIDVVILGTVGAYADIDRNDWVQPKSIDTGNTSVTFTSQLSGNISINITGSAIFEGNATYNK